MNVIFLDCDGVLNRIDPPHYQTPTCAVNGHLIMVEPDLICRLNLLVERTGAHVVLSSSWRHSPAWREELKVSGLVRSILDRTPLCADHKYFGVERQDLVRGHEIQQWLDGNPEVARYAILDDSDEMLPHQIPNFFQTDERLGLTQEIADAVQAHLASS